MTIHLSDKQVQEKIESFMDTPETALTQDMLRPFVSGFLEKKEDYIDAVYRHGSPLYLLDMEALKERAETFRNAFQDGLPETSFYFAVKSNNHPAIAGQMMACGFGLDVSSGVELEMALSVNAEDIVFSGPGKTDGELEKAIDHWDNVVVLIDSFSELSRLNAMAAKKGRHIRAGVRVNPHPHGLWRKFGIPLSKVNEFFLHADQCRHVSLQGLQFHTSWNLGPDRQVDVIGMIGNLMAEMTPSHLARIEFLDIGGGYWPSMGEWLQERATLRGGLMHYLELGQPAHHSHFILPSTSIVQFSQALCHAVHTHIFSKKRVRICFEPGRWIANDAMHLVFTVIDKKYDDLVITDAGTNTVGWERFESDYFPVLNLSDPALSERGCLITGSLCTPHDIWGYGYWGNSIKVGDVLMIPTQGAYTYSLRQHFIKPLPQVVAV